MKVLVKKRKIEVNAEASTQFNFYVLFGLKPYTSMSIVVLSEPNL